MRRLWYRWKLSKWTRKTNQARARWLAVKKVTTEGRGWVNAEDHYCKCAIEMHYFEKLLHNPELPKATARG